MIKKGKVSILSANYNNGPYLNEFFDSIAHQSYRDIEVIFIDDASVDDSNKKMESITANYPFDIKYIKLEENVGFANALNLGLTKCSGEYVARIDPDDVMSKDRILKQVEYLNSHPNVSIVGSNAIYFKESIGNVVGSSNFKSDSQWIKDKYLAAEYGMMHGTLTFRRLAFSNVQYCQLEVPAEDYSLISRMISNQCEVFNLKDELTSVRIHSNSVSNSLPITTITKLFSLRQDIFGVKFVFFNMVFKYLHFRCYRNSLKANSFFYRVFFVFLSALFAPVKSFKILFGRLY